MGLRGIGAKPKPKRKCKPVRKNTDTLSAISLHEQLVAFIESLPITSGVLVGQNFKLLPFPARHPESDLPDRRAWLAGCTAGSYHHPRKQGKTAFTAALALAALCGPLAEQRGQVFSAAADRQQAALIYNEMKAIIAAVPELDSRIIVRDFTKHLEDTVTGSIYMALSSDSKTKHGLSASFLDL